MTDKIEFHTTNSNLHNTWVMRITEDRRIEVNEDVEVTEAAQKVLEAMQYLLAQPEERNFCPRCGKRLGQNDWDVHTCTPPQLEQEPVANGYIFVAIPILEKLGINRAVIDTIATTPPQPKEPEQGPLAWMSADRFDELRQGFTVVTTLTKKKAFEDDVAIYTTPPQPDQKTVAWHVYFGNEDEPNYVCLGEKPTEKMAVIRPLVFGDSAPPQRTWVGLTDEEIEARAINFYNPEMYKRAVLWAQEKLKERNQ